MTSFDHPLTSTELAERRRFAREFHEARNELANDRGIEPHPDTEAPPPEGASDSEGGSHD